jgi:hypothetical protein
MNTGTRVMLDKRTARRRTRAAEELSAIWADDYDEECDGLCRAGRYCVQHGDGVSKWLE